MYRICLIYTYIYVYVYDRLEKPPFTFFIGSSRNYFDFSEFVHFLFKLEGVTGKIPVKMKTTLRSPPEGPPCVTGKLRHR